MGWRVLGVSLVILLLPLLAPSQEKPDPQHKVKIGQEAPDFTLQYTDGRTCKLSDLRGKVVMLQFTASWCSVCRSEMPFIEKEIWQPHQARKDFVLAGVDLKEDARTIADFSKKTRVSYPILLDPSGAIFNLYAEKDAGVTRNVIIDRNGKIVFLTRLFQRDEFDRMKAKIEDLLAQGVSATR
jgi:peroxiredoxin